MKTKLIWLVVIVVAVALIWSRNSGTNEEVTETSTSTPTVMTTEANNNPNDTSDSAVLKDSASIDAQMKSLDNDSSSADQGLNDKQIVQ